MLQYQWPEILDQAAKESGTPLRLFAHGCAHDSSECFAVFVSTLDGKRKNVKLSLDLFNTDEAIKAEVIRQLSA